VTLDAVSLVVLALATYRVARFVVEDTLFDKPRAWALTHWPGNDTEFTPEVIERRGSRYFNEADVELVVVRSETEGTTWVAAEPTMLGKWLECVWCVSVWVAAAIVVIDHHWAGFEWVTVPLALSAAAGWIHASSE